MKCPNCDGIIEIITSKKYPDETIEVCFCGLRLGDKKK